MSQRAAPALRCVVFDLGGVLVRICRTWQEACARAGVHSHDDLATPEMIAARRPLRDAYETGRLSCDEFFAAVAATTDGRVSPWEFRRVHEAWVIGEYPGVRDLIAAIHRAGLSTGVLSNTNHSHWQDLAAGVASLVHHPHASHLLGVAKPDLDIYRAFERASGFEPAQVLFFDDLPDNIGGAGAAGWDAALIDHAGDTAAQMRDALHARGVRL